MIDFFVSVNLAIKINTTQTRFSKNLQTSALYFDPYEIFISVLLCQCFDKDYMTSSTKFDKVT